MKKTILCILLGLMTAASYAQSRMNAQKIRVIDSLLSYLSAENRFMGTICIRENNKTLLNKSYGAMGVKNGKLLPANPQTKYRIGSISKSYTAAMILQLAEEKNLPLDDKLSRYFKEIPNATKISIRQLLNHQSGLYNFTNDLQWRSQFSLVSKKEMLAAFAKDKPDFEPGTKTAYSNTNYMLLGYIIEQVSGKSFNDNLQARISKQLNLKGTSLPKGSTDILKNEALSFDFGNDQQWEAIPEIHVSASDGAGGIIAPAEEVSRFFEALFQNKLLTAATVKEMLPVQGKNSITPINSYGYGLETLPFGNEHIAYGHSGHIDGFYTMCGYCPEDKLSISFFDNGQVMGFNQINIYLLSIIFDKAYTFPSFTKVNVSNNELAGLAGHYGAKDLPLDVQVMAHGNQLWAQASGQDSFRLSAMGKDKFEFQQADITMTFVRGADDQAQSLSMVQDGEKLILNRKSVEHKEAKTIKVDVALLESYEGIYSAAELPMKLTIRKTGTGLSGQGTGQPEFPLAAMSDTEFQFEPISLSVKFKKNSAGKTTGLMLTQGKTIELTKE